MTVNCGVAGGESAEAAPANTRRSIGSLCTGIGGLDLAVEAHFGADLAWYSEIEPAPCEILRRVYPDVKNHGDLTLIDWASVEPVDILTAGYPCQPFSEAGNRKGASDVRHLWPFIANAVRHLRPRYVVLENVRGHLTLGFDAVLGSLAEAGFDAEWCLLRASDVGACHQRARVFVVASEPHQRRWDGRREGQPAATGDGHEAGLGWAQGADQDAAHAHGLDVDGGGDAGPVGRTEPADGGETPAHPEGRSGAHESNGGPTAGQAVGPVAGSGGGDRPGDLAEGVHVGGQPSGELVWGVYAPAIARWEGILGRPAPAPRDDAGRLAPPFVEWMMGYPEGWADGLTRTQALRALGNAVVPQQALAALAELAPEAALTGAAA